MRTSVRTREWVVIQCVGGTRETAGPRANSRTSGRERLDTGVRTRRPGWHATCSVLEHEGPRARGYRSFGVSLPAAGAAFHRIATPAIADNTDAAKTAIFAAAK